MPCPARTAAGHISVATGFGTLYGCLDVLTTPQPDPVVSGAVPFWINVFPQRNSGISRIQEPHPEGVIPVGPDGCGNQLQSKVNISIIDYSYSVMHLFN